MKESDHNTILTEFNHKVMAKALEEKIEVYNLKNKDCQKKFRKYTSKTNMLSSIFDDTLANIDVLTDRLVKKINGCVAVSFKKRRVCLNKKEDKHSPYDRLRELKGKDDEESNTELASVIKIIAENAEENFN